LKLGAKASFISLLQFVLFVNPIFGLF
jgi:hypothetical protein